jgi:2-polyprenyl-3-methyl-5-hydroxy-6-metoxy-1,4-benzoquinol methylase
MGTSSWHNIECDQKRTKGDEFRIICVSSQHWTQSYTSAMAGNCWCGYRNNLHRIFHTLHPDLLSSHSARYKMAKDYFTDHYAPLNGIDPKSEDSIRHWLQQRTQGYELELGHHIETLKGKTVLELGCGIGGMLHYLKTQGVTDIFGVDISTQQVEICKKFVTENVIQGDAIEYLRTTTRKYDYIFAFDFVEHLRKEQIPEFCILLHGALNDEGIVILRTPNMGSLFGLHSRYIDFTHEVGFTEESIRQILREAGFLDSSVFNTYVGYRRRWCIHVFQRLLEKLYNTKFSRVVTLNMLIIAKRSVKL